MTIIEDAEEAPAYAPYRIDSDVAEALGRSLSVIISRRQCYMCAQGYEDGEAALLDAEGFIDQIVAHCSEEQDFLLPDTPMKEAIFRVLLQNGNEPMDAEGISAVLTEKWAMTPFPRNTSASVIQRLLDDGAYYCLAAAEVEVDGDGEI